MGMLIPREGQVFSLNGQVMTIQQVLSNNNLLLISDRGESFLKNIDDLYRSHVNNDITTNKNYKETRYLGKIKNIKLSSDLTGEHDILIKKRLAYINDAMHVPFGPLLTLQIQRTHQRIKDENKIPCNSSVWAWKKRYIESNYESTSLIPKIGDKGKWERFKDEEINICKDYIWSHYLSMLCPTVENTIRTINKRIDEINETRLVADHLKHITRCVFERVLKTEHTPYDIDLRRKGRDFVISKYRGVINSPINHHVGLYMGAMDHTKLDIIVLDDNGRIMQRPWITLLICSATRCILGVYIGFTPPSDSSLTKCLKNSFLPKIDLKHTYPGIQNEWLAFGPLMNVKVDNAFEFHSHTFERICGDTDTKIIYCARKQPWFKAEIERYIGTQNDLLHQLPGSTFSNPTDRGDYNSQNEACISLSNLKFLIMKWIVDVYHQTKHSGLNFRTPHEMWQILVDQKNIPLVTDLGDIDYLLAKATSRIVDHRGVSNFGLWYSSHELIELRKECGHKFKTNIRYTEEDLGAIWVVHPRQKDFYIRVPAVDQDYANGLTRFQHRIHRAYALKNDLGNTIVGYKEARDAVNIAIQNETKKLGSRGARYAEKSPIWNTMFQTNSSPNSSSDDEIYWDVPNFDLEIAGGLS